MRAIRPALVVPIVAFCEQRLCFNHRNYSAGRRRYARSSSGSVGLACGTPTRNRPLKTSHAHLDEYRPPRSHRARLDRRRKAEVLTPWDQRDARQRHVAFPEPTRSEEAAVDHRPVFCSRYDIRTKVVDLTRPSYYRDRRCFFGK